MRCYTNIKIGDIVKAYTKSRNQEETELYRINKLSENNIFLIGNLIKDKNGKSGLYEERIIPLNMIHSVMKANIGL